MIVQYDAAGERPGEITMTLSIFQPAMREALVAAGKTFIEVPDLSVDVSRFFVRDGMLTARPAMPHAIDRRMITADGADVMVITGLPQPCTLHFVDHLGETDSVVCDDGTAEISAVDPGHHRLQIEAWPYLPLDITYTATPPGRLPAEDGMSEIWTGEKANAD